MSNQADNQNKRNGRLRNRPTRIKTGSRESVDGRRKVVTSDQIRSIQLCENYHKQLQENVRILRTAYRMSQLHLAQKCGWARTTVVRLESGERHPAWGQVCVLANVLGVPLGLFEKNIAWVFAANNGNQLPDLLRDLRISRGLTQKQLSEQLGIGNSAYTDIESGKRLADTQTLIAIADMFCQKRKLAA